MTVEKSQHERAVLVHVELSEESENEDFNEFRELARAAGVDPVAELQSARKSPDPKTFLGEGKVDELAEVVRLEAADVLLVNHPLSPGQARNLEKLVGCKVLDRTEVILDIFAQRARTHEGQLQVELAQLEHLSTRLIRGWTHLERQKGGIGLRGPGETQLESDRRMIRQRIKTLHERLNKVRRHRELSRKSRKKAEMQTLALVGYTNAGKSTLFNRLCEAHVWVADQVFATLDPTLRSTRIPHVGKVVLADTVGFIRHLPHKLVDAFRATLEETEKAELLLHVIDASATERASNIRDVEDVLTEIGADKLPCLRVYNKIDHIPQAVPRIDRNDLGEPTAVWISAKQGDGLELLQQAIGERLSQHYAQGLLSLDPEQGKCRSELYGLGAVMDEVVDDNGNWVITVKLLQSELDRLKKRHELKMVQWQPALRQGSERS